MAGIQTSFYFVRLFSATCIKISFLFRPLPWGQGPLCVLRRPDSRPEGIRVDLKILLAGWYNRRSHLQLEEVSVFIRKKSVPLTEWNDAVKTSCFCFVFLELCGAHPSSVTTTPFLPWPNETILDYITQLFGFNPLLLTSGVYDSILKTF